MTSAEIMEYIKASGGVCAPLLLVALIWMNNERKNALTKYENSNDKLQNLSERTLILLTEIKGLFGSRPNV
jgi:hypothetical protein